MNSDLQRLKKHMNVNYAFCGEYIHFGPVVTLCVNELKCHFISDCTLILLYFGKTYCLASLIMTIILSYISESFTLKIFFSIFFQICKPKNLVLISNNTFFQFENAQTKTAVKTFLSFANNDLFSLC